MSYSNHTIVFFCEKMAMGGTETLTLRLLKWYQLKGFRVILLTLKKVESETILKDFKEINFEHYVYDKVRKDFFSVGEKILKFDKNEYVKVNTQFLPEFIRCYDLLNYSKYKCFFIHTIFIVHPFSTHLFGSKFKIFGKTIIKILYKNSNIVFMDEACVDECINYYQLDEKRYKSIICRLPLFVDKTENSIIKRNETFNILTILRFEFPFKAYVLGLIESFIKIKNENSDINISLTIIGYGKGKSKVDELLNKIPTEIRKFITVVGEMPYSEIKGYIHKCDVLVGMGTTILDAANLNKIIIVPAAYQTGNYAISFFHDNWKVLGEIYDKEKNYETLDKLLIEVINSDDSKYEEMSKISKEMLVKHYDIDQIAQQILNHTTRIHSLYNRLLVKIISILYFTAVYLKKTTN